MKNGTRTALVILLFTSAVVTRAEGANKYAGEFLTHGVGARPMGMGNAFVAVVDDATSGYWNPAGVADATAPEAQLMHSETFGDVINYDTGAYVRPLGDGSGVSVTIIRLAIDDIAFTDFIIDDDRIRYDPDRITWESDSELAVLVTYGKRLGDRLRVGANLKMISKNIADNSCYGLGFDLGAKYSVWDNMTLGANLQDATTTFLVWDTKQRERIMPTAKIGIAYHRDVPSMAGRLILAADLDIRFENRVTADQYHIGRISADTHCGVEFCYKDLVSVRTGVAMGQLTAGAGIRLGSFCVDYAFGKHAYLDSSHRVSASYAFWTA